MDNIINDLCCIKSLAESMNDCNWQDMSDKIVNIANQHLANYAVACCQATASKPRQHKLKFFRSWLDHNGKKHFCIDQYDNVTCTAVSPRDHFFA